MKLKLDENISRHLKPIMENLNYDVLTVSDQDLVSKRYQNRRGSKDRRKNAFDS
jgi:hypothetical protein